MINPLRELPDVEAVLAVTGPHPYVRHALGRGLPLRAYRRGDAVVWAFNATVGLTGGGYGPVDDLLDMVGALVEAGRVSAGEWWHMPRLSPVAPPGEAPVGAFVHWDFRWTDEPPAVQPDEDRVVRLTEADRPALVDLVDRAYPESTARPDDPRIVEWYGIRDGDRLVACGANRSRGAVGFLAGLTVAPEVRGQGLGAALTTAMTRTLLTRYGQVALGVYPTNLGAIRLYERLGFTDRFPLTSVRVD